ncbi:von Willebrand factor A domain-containing protein 2 [Bulinus truncatus]|nr:von Willebrand factor A domain-containing protein 2 [Bulinus truncatus]
MSNLLSLGLTRSDERLLDAAVSFVSDVTRHSLGSASELDSIALDFAQLVCEAKDECVNNPCQNGGTCENGEKTYACSCAPGFAGKHCERACDDRFDIVFLIDSSGSVGFDNFRHIKDYVQNLIDNVNIGPDATQVGVATFSQSSKAEIFLNSYKDKRALKAAVSGLKYEYGNTNTASGLKLARLSLFSTAKGNRPNAPDFLIVITDGLSNVNAEDTIPEAQLARKQGIHVIAVGVNLKQNDDWELKGIANQPSDSNVFKVDSFDKLWDVTDSIVDNTCRDQGVCSPNPCENDGQCIAGVGTFTCQCTQGFLGPRCEYNCQNNKDIVFILDSSASVGPTN